MPLDGFRVNMNGDMDLQGFTDLDDKVTPAYQTIRAKVHVKAGGNEKDIKDFLEFTSSHSPMCDSVSRPVHVTYSLRHNGQAIGPRLPNDRESEGPD
jgi:hypothetical protein